MQYLLHQIVTVAGAASFPHSSLTESGYRVARWRPTSPTTTSSSHALRAGDEAAFAWLLDQYHAPLHRTARMYVATDAQADEVVQETWVAVLGASTASSTDRR